MLRINGISVCVCGGQGGGREGLRLYLDRAPLLYLLCFIAECIYV